MRNRLLAWLGSLYLRFVAATSQILWLQRDVRDRLESQGKGFIYAFWHGRQVFLAYLHRGDAIHPLVSQSRDGELISQVCASFGIRTVRGSSSRGGSSAVRQLQDELAKGDRIGITPDGPRGPLREVQSGVLYLAQSAGVPIVPVAFGARRRWIFGSWDEFMVPKPFNRIAIAYGTPLTVAPEADLSERADVLKRALDATAQLADQAVAR